MLRHCICFTNVMENRRNYYRILQVQPDAPIEIIRTSYRALMKELKKHPDLEGDHWSASIINEAYEILSNNVKRAAYDRDLFYYYTKKIPPPEISEKKSFMNIACPFCNRSLIRQTTSDKICPFCIDSNSERNKTVTHNNCHRSEHRIKKDGRLRYDFALIKKGREAKMLDLSPRGVRFICSDNLQPDSTITIGCPLFKAVARVVNSGNTLLNGKKLYSVGARFLSVRFIHSRGSFYSSTV